MMERNWVAAYGGVKYVVDGLQPQDIVFYSHKWEGLIAAAEVTGPARDAGIPDIGRCDFSSQSQIENEALLDECRFQK